MARAYTLATAALALHIPAKWLDNTLSHHHVQGVDQVRQGVPRRLSVASLTIIAAALILIGDLQIPLARALVLATELSRSNGRLVLPGSTKIEIDLDHIRHQLLERLEHAVEVAPLPRRGRPPTKTTGRLE